MTAWCLNSAVKILSTDLQVSFPRMSGLSLVCRDRQPTLTFVIRTGLPCVASASRGRKKSAEQDRRTRHGAEWKKREQESDRRTRHWHVEDRRHRRRVKARRRLRGHWHGQLAFAR